MNSKTLVLAAAALVALAALVAVWSRREPAPAAVPAKAAAAPTAIAAPAAARADPVAAGLEAKLRLLEARAREFGAAREEREGEEKEKEQRQAASFRRSLASSSTGRWVSDLQLTDEQRVTMRQLFERWFQEDDAREKYRSMDRRTFEAREAELRGVLTPAQQQARCEMVRDQIRDLWKTLSVSVSLLREDKDVSPLFLGEPWSPGSRARADQLMKQIESIRALSPETQAPPAPEPLPDPALLGECPPIPEGMLLADAHDLGILGLWRQAEPKARALLSPAQLENYAKLLPESENPVYLHGY